MRKTLFHTGWRYLLRHPWQSVLMILGITLGVAVMVAVDLANASASRAFDLSTEAVAGRATHQINGGPGGIDQQVYARLRQADLGAPMAPVITEYVALAQLGGQPMQLLGVDIFAEAPFRSYLTSGDGAFGGDPARLNGAAPLDLAAFLTRPGVVFISEGIAERFGLTVGQVVALEVGGRQADVQIGGLLQPQDALARRALDGLVLADLATAQELTGRLGRLDRIDMILPEDSAALASRLRALLPADVHLDATSARSGALAQMTAAFRLNLTALSLLALVVGMFLIYNTMTFSVVQRRPLFGALRCLGVTRQEVFALVMGEALLVGLLGALLGAGVGMLMGQGAVRLVTQTVNDLFFVVTVRGVQILPGSLVKGLLVGVLATLLTAAPPAWEAAATPPRAALSRSTLELKARKAVTVAAFVGMALMLIGGGLLALPGRTLLVSFAGTFAVVVGFAMLAPVATTVLMRSATRPLGRLWGTLGRMAPRDVINSLSRTSIAVMALMVAVSVTIGVSLMVGSFRSTVIDWLAETLQGDIYISAPGLTSTTPSIAIQPAALEMLRQHPAAARVDTLRAVEVNSPVGPVDVAATDNFSVGEERAFLSLRGSAQQVWSRLLAGGVLISEPLANRLGITRPGGEVTLYTREGPRDFPVVGIYYDYASSQGTVLMALPVYQVLWQDPAITAVALRLAPGASPDAVVGDLQTKLADVQRVQIRANQALRQEVLAVFDRTFAITRALQLLATVVAFMGVLSALLSLELERQRELGILRSIGMTVRQLWTLILLETGLMGAAAGLLAMPTGYVLALILVYIINRRSFGWTLQLDLQALPFAQALGLAIVAAVLAGLYPAYRMGRMITSEALRSE